MFGSLYASGQNFTNFKYFLECLLMAEFCLNKSLPQENEFLMIINTETKTLVLLTKSITSSSTLINTIMENKITSIWNKIKSTRDTFSKIALTKELDELVTLYKNELITKFQREKK